MRQILFPAINLKLNILPTAAEVFGIKIYWYGIIIVFGIIVALLVCKLNEKKFTIGFQRLLDLLIIVLPISFICARLYYVLFRLNTYILNPKEIFDIRRRRACNIWRNNWRRFSLLYILQDKENKFIRSF